MAENEKRASVRPRNWKPGPRCPVCNHPERARIETAKAAGVSYRVLAEKFGLSKDSLHRHWTNCVRPETKAELLAGPVKLKELAGKAAEENLSVLESLSIVRARLMHNFLAASEMGDANATATLSGRLLETLREAGRLTGEIARLAPNQTTIINNTMILESPQYARLQLEIINALNPFPEARVAVAAALRRIANENEGAPSGRMIESRAAPIVCEAVHAAE